MIMSKYFGNYDKNYKFWYVKITYGNSSWNTTIGNIPRSETRTAFLFKAQGETSYHGPPYNASNLFPNSSVRALMKIRANIKIWNVGCPTYYRSTSGEFTALREKPRCAGTGVVSWHNATLNGV